ncbi:YveK family protein [Williamsia phyllosphaerae]|uniref:Polysaccharide chain length determinant N-terminal domain-containing protein n=1 Tax=Williamsia phyllosphaerae TaxID=885042 RepID=A0ABQ1UWK3_9NOCA|nr:Wzz/FepE/Etk N-terminal domain-containing protein [Williamsia phyllosphaerae]GGF28632.1 hypothetical protein GCM10007298_25560 [Williamsia phyllosphaerae]
MRDYLRILAANWMVIAIATVLSAGAGYVSTLIEQPQYTASVKLFATVAGDSGVRAAQQGDLGATARMTTYQQMATSSIVLQRTIDQLKLDTTTGELATEVLAVIAPKSVVLDLTVSASEASRAIDTVNALGGNLARLSQEVESTDDGPVAELVPVGGATGAQRVESSIVDALTLGGGIGFALSAVLVLARALIRDRAVHRSQLNNFVEQSISTSVVRKTVT